MARDYRIRARIEGADGPSGSSSGEIRALERVMRDLKKATKEAERERKRLEHEQRRRSFRELMPGLRGDSRGDVLSRLGLRRWHVSQQSEARTDLEGRNEFVREPSGWRVKFDGVEIWLRDMKGLAYLQLLIAHPRKGFAPTDLVANIDGVGPGVEGAPLEDDLGSGSMRPTRDRRTSAAVREGIQEITDDIEAAEERGDEEGAEKHRQRLADLSRELSHSYGLGEVERDEGALEEKARKAVQMAISRAFDAIEQHHPALAEHLKKSVRGGSVCSYEPHKKLDWVVTPAVSA